WGAGAVKRVEQSGPPRLRAEAASAVKAGRFRDGLGVVRGALHQGADQLFGAERRGAVLVVVGCPVEDLPTLCQRFRRLVADDALGVGGGVLGRIETQPPDDVLQAEFVLETERDCFGGTCQKEVAWHSCRVDATRSSAVPGQPGTDRLVGAVLQFVRDPRRDEPAAMLERGPQCLSLLL